MYFLLLEIPINLSKFDLLLKDKRFFICVALKQYKSSKALKTKKKTGKHEHMTKSTPRENENKTLQSFDNKIIYCARNDSLDKCQMKSNSL